MFIFDMKSSNFAAKFLFMYSSVMFFLSLYFFLTNKIILFEWEGLQINSAFMSMVFILDWISVSFSSIVCFISACVMVFSSSYMKGEVFLSRFIWLVMLFVLSMNFLIFIPSLLGLLLGWDGLGLVSFALVIYYQNPKSLGAGLMTALMNRIGDVAILLSIGWCHSEGHWQGLLLWDGVNMWLVCFCLLVAGLTKSAQIPFSSWLPAAMAAPTPVSALVHSSTLVTAGVFLIIRFYPFLSMFYWFKPSLLIIAVMTMLMAGVVANLESDLKKIIALSTLSQLGVMMSSLGTGQPMLALFHLYVHALFKALLFICAGSIIHSHYNWQDIRAMGQLWVQMPVSTTCLNIANLALCGSPFLAGFYSKDVIIELMIMNDSNLIVLLMTILATFLTASYSIRLSMMSLWGPMKHKGMGNISDEDSLLYLPAIFLTTGAIIGGAAMSWLFMFPLSLVFVSLEEKLIPLTMVMGGVLITISLLSMNKKKSMSLLMYFFSTMWFLSLLSNNFISKPVLVLGFYYSKNVDMGWLEMFSGGGLFKLASNSMIFNQKVQKNVFYIFLVMILNLIFIIPMLMTAFFN